MYEQGSPYLSPKKCQFCPEYLSGDDLMLATFMLCHQFRGRDPSEAQFAYSNVSTQPHEDQEAKYLNYCQ